MSLPFSVTSCGAPFRSISGANVFSVRACSRSSASIEEQRIDTPQDLPHISKIGTKVCQVHGETGGNNAEAPRALDLIYCHWLRGGKSIGPC